MKKILVTILLISLVAFCFAATYRKNFHITNSDQTDFNSSDSAGAAVRIWNYGTDQSGGSKTLSGSMTEVGSGIWYYAFDEDSSGFYALQSYTTATPSWTDIGGFAPIYVSVAAPLHITGGTMEGAIAMGDNSITGIDALTFTDVNGEIAGVRNGNLLDKAAAETIAGAYDFDGACTVTAGSFDFTTDKLLINSIITQPYIYLTYSEGSASYVKQASVNKTLFICDAAYEVVSIEGVFETAETTAATLYLQVERLSTTEAKGGGDDMLTNNANNGFNLKGTAKTVLTGTLTNNTLADGDRIGLVLSTDGTECAGLSITIVLKRV